MKKFIKMQMLRDHVHSHVGNNRGMSLNRDGFNYRIVSEVQLWFWRKRAKCLSSSRKIVSTKNIDQASFQNSGSEFQHYC